MPTIEASVGTVRGWNGNEASAPRTKNTSSPTPAPAASVATRVRPNGDAVLGQRLDHEQGDAGQACVLVGADDGPDDARDLHGILAGAVDGGDQPAVVTSSTMPTMTASTGQSFIPVAMRAELPLTISTSLADAGVDGVDGDERRALGLARRIDGPDDEQLVADEAFVLAGGDDRAGDAGEQHGNRPAPTDRDELSGPGRGLTWPPCRSGGRLRGWRAGAG